MSAGHQGLSPRVRGNPGPRRGSSRGHGSIPACAGEPWGSSAVVLQARVYPRVCGGTGVPAPAIDNAAGLSPRVRGNRPRCCWPGTCSGSIPACAGEPKPPAPAGPASGVYPRVCGGTTSGSQTSPAHSGLSPRVRGNRRPSPRYRYLPGSIPACAGEPPRDAARRLSEKVYPRVCGGTPALVVDHPEATGLSPRVRGNPDHAARRCAGGGSIPACAGEPVLPVRGRPVMRVYPRVCGGTALRGGADFSMEGLSPRVRGNPTWPASHPCAVGSIPACAGEPRSIEHPPGLPWVYPRVCGGTRNRDREGRSARGLSPRVRGNPGPPRMRLAHVGSIPACAGEPGAENRTRCLCEVYPRVCGGTSSSTMQSRHFAGLSPRVRGNPHPGAVRRVGGGSIPACAGEPL